MATTRLLEFITNTPDHQRALISAAIAAANPDIDGDLMRHLNLRGVDHIVKEAMAIARSNRRSRYVQGWRPD